MIYISILVAIAAIVALVIARAIKDDTDKKMFKVVAACAAALSIVFGAFSVITTIQAGHVGVKVLFGSVQDGYLEEGFNLVNPLVSVHERTVQTVSTNMIGENAIDALSANGLKMRMDVTVNYRVLPGDAAWAFQNLGRNIHQDKIQPALREAVRKAASEFESNELYSTKRQAAADRMMVLLRGNIDKVINEYGYEGDVVSIQQILVRNVTLPPAVATAIEDKSAKEQESQAMVYSLQIEKQEAERKAIEAGGIAEFQRIVKQGIDKDLLTWKAIEATAALAASPNAKVVIFGSNESGGLPLILNPGQ